MITGWARKNWLQILLPQLPAGIFERTELSAGLSISFLINRIRLVLLNFFFAVYIILFGFIASCRKSSRNCSFEQGNSVGRLWRGCAYMGCAQWRHCSGCSHTMAHDRLRFISEAVSKHGPRCNSDFPFTRAAGPFLSVPQRQFRSALSRIYGHFSPSRYQFSAVLSRERALRESGGLKISSVPNINSTAPGANH